ncbi:MAG TPA: DUF86 domain-containing protein [Bacillota bacterium]|nr:DUF86 domain-containing protein [Bacillota bacterium]
MVADAEMLRRKIADLTTYIDELQKLQEYSLDELRQNLTALWSIAHGLQLAIQVVLDTGNHILADRGIKAMDYTEVIDLLGQKKIIPKEFAAKIRGMAGFRNILVHGYTTLDVERVHTTLQNNLGDFRQFASYIWAFLEREG